MDYCIIYLLDILKFMWHYILLSRLPTHHDCFPSIWKVGTPSVVVAELHISINFVVISEHKMLSFAWLFWLRYSIFQNKYQQLRANDCFMTRFLVEQIVMNNDLIFVLILKVPSAVSHNWVTSTTSKGSRRSGRFFTDSHESAGAVRRYVELQELSLCPGSDSYF